jgi:DNA-binding MarR family transcriptional regulator
MTLLIISTILVPLLGIAAGLDWFVRRRHHRYDRRRITHSELLAGMRKLLAEDDPLAPIVRPRFLSRFTQSKGEPNWGAQPKEDEQENVTNIRRKKTRN